MNGKSSARSAKANVQIGNYTVIRSLGAGGMGIVFRVADQTGRPFAIKMIGSRAAIHGSLHADQARRNAIALDLGTRMQFVREARLAMQLTHPNIIRTFDYNQQGGLLYIVVEYLRGRSLDKVIPIHGAVPFPAKIRMIRQICDGLDYAHQHGVMHRDIKPANVFVLQDGNVKVMDFGLAARLREPLPGQVAFVGTPQYMAPEVVAASHVYDARVDIWSTGVTLYQLLTGRLPFFAPSISQLLYNITHAPFPRLDPQLPHVLELERILDQALAKSPLERYGTAGDLARDLKGLEEEVAERRSLSVGNSKAVDDDPWWASTVTHIADSPEMELSEGGETVTVISGEIRARRRRHKERFVSYCLKVGPPIAVGSLFAGFFAIFMVVSHLFFSLPHASLMEVLRASISVERNVPTMLLFRLPLFVFGFGVPVAVALGIGFGILTLLEKLAEIPHCRTCCTWMKHQSRVDRFSYTEKSRAHAASDCLAALKENLWVDAAKLLSMHGEVFSPKENKKNHLPLIRYYLDFYACRQCGDESAMLTTEDGLGRIWRARAEYQGAYKARNKLEGKLSVANRWHDIYNALGRAVGLTLEAGDQDAFFFAIAMALFLGIYYYSLVPQLLRIFEHKALVTIKSDPPGQSVLVDGSLMIAPKTFSWHYESVHNISGLADREVGGSLYHFRELTAKFPTQFNFSYEDRVVCRGIGAPPAKHCTVMVIRAQDGERPENHALVPSYTVVFTKAENIQNGTARQGSDAPRGVQNRQKPH
jgi:serine/threonine protein kinase